MGKDSTLHTRAKHHTFYRLLRHACQFGATLTQSSVVELTAHNWHKKVGYVSLYETQDELFFFHLRCSNDIHTSKKIQCRHHPLTNSHLFILFLPEDNIFLIRYRINLTCTPITKEGVPNSLLQYDSSSTLYLLSFSHDS